MMFLFVYSVLLLFSVILVLVLWIMNYLAKPFPPPLFWYCVRLIVPCFRVYCIFLSYSFFFSLPSSFLFIIIFLFLSLLLTTFLPFLSSLDSFYYTCGWFIRLLASCSFPWCSCCFVIFCYFRVSFVNHYLFMQTFPFFFVLRLNLSWYCVCLMVPCLVAYRMFLF